MVSYEFTSKYWNTFRDGIRQEWALTNGIGGYAGSSLINAHNRTHQGYLIASLHPPIERYLVFSKINESISCCGHTYSFETSQHKSDGKSSYTEGQKYLQKVRYDGTIQHFYEADKLRLTRSVCLKRGANLCAITYDIENSGEDATLSLTPLFNYREHSQSSKPETLLFSTSLVQKGLKLVPASASSVSIFFEVSEGEFQARKELYDVDMQLQIEVDQETDGLDCHYTPYDVVISLPAGCKKKISIICSVNEPDFSATDAEAIFQETKAYYTSLLEHAGFQDAFANQLVLASDAFLSDRESTGMKTVLAGLPWFTDWGRDTMIAYTGLTLCTRRYEEAKEILLTFAKYIHHGIVPNMFPDTNAEPLYNTVDASLWYFYAVDQYLKAVSTEEAYDFIRDNIFSHLKEIISAYEHGTDFSIYMDTDGLIHAGSGLDQITWMDVRVGDWVATPRHGKPVEINALWYNALKVMENLCQHFGESAVHYTELSEKVKHSFLSKFWWEEKDCLYDVVDGDPDDHIRPNQIYAVSLPYSMVTPEMAQKIVALVQEKLYIGCGLRSLSPEHPDYHGIYAGALAKRDAAYHQGTAWGFLLGGFLTAYLKVEKHSPESIQNALKMLEPVKHHLSESGCIGSISEIFDGNAPHNPRGCYAQAWSVGEVLRAYVQDILPYLSK
ncbi:MAG: amylo-alpha-1,6-glucosidase [Roseburia sp.]